MPDRIVHDQERPTTRPVVPGRSFPGTTIRKSETGISAIRYIYANLISIPATPKDLYLFSLFF